MDIRGRSNIDRVPGLRELRDSCARAERVIIAVIDGPVEASHPAFRNARLEHLGGLTIAEAVRSSRAHGTHVSSILFADPDGPIEGIAPACRGLLVSVFTDTAEDGIHPCSEPDMARALLLARDRGANVINISAGRPSGTGIAGVHLNDAIRQCLDSGILIVAAAGNDGCNCLQVPAALPGVLVVGAMDDHGEPVGFSNWGDAYRAHGVLAPGTEIIGAAAGAEVVGMSGTSFAAPLVAGTAALLMARQLESGQRPDAPAVMEAILRGADGCDPAAHSHCERFLSGTLNATNALRFIEMQPSIVPSFTAGVDKRKRSQATMDEHRQETQSPFDGNAMAESIKAMADSMKTIQDNIADLARNLGGLRPSGLDEAGDDTEPAGTSPAISVDGQTEPIGSARETAIRYRPSNRLVAPATRGEMIMADACCDACAAREARQLVFALGKLGYDFGNEARMDSIQTQMQAARNGDGSPVVEGHEPSASNAADLVAFLRASPSVAPAINWTLKLDETTLYGIRPEGYYVQETYAALVNALDQQTTSAAAASASPPSESTGSEGGRRRATQTDTPPIPPPAVERMSLPGITNGQVELMNGLVVPTVRPALAGMFTWSTEALVEALDKLPTANTPNDEGKDGAFNPRDGLRTFLNRIYEELRNAGLAPQDRALNFAATNAYQANDIFVKLRGRNIHIERFEVVRSPVTRPESDCWDVKMTFYNPAGLTTTPREVYFYTIDVSDVVPVAIGKPRHWTTF